MSIAVIVVRPRERREVPAEIQSEVTPNAVTDIANLRAAYLRRLTDLGNSYLSFLVDPLSNIRGAINDLSAAGLACPKKPNDIEIYERQFR